MAIKKFKPTTNGRRGMSTLTNEEMILIGQKSLTGNGFSFFLFGFYTVYSSLFLALGKGTAGFILGACRQGICFLPVILLLPGLLGMNGILYAQPIADTLSAIVTVFMAMNLHKKLSSEEQIPKKSDHGLENW